MQALGGIQPHPAAKGFDKVTGCQLSTSISRLINLLSCCSVELWPLPGVDQAAPTSNTSIIRCHVSLHPRNDLSALEVACGSNRQRCW